MDTHTNATDSNTTSLSFQPPIIAGPEGVHYLSLIPTARTSRQRAAYSPPLTDMHHDAEKQQLQDDTSSDNDEDRDCPTLKTPPPEEYYSERAQDTQNFKVFKITINDNKSTTDTTQRPPGLRTPFPDPNRLVIDEGRNPSGEETDGFETPDEGVDEDMEVSEVDQGTAETTAESSDS